MQWLTLSYSLPGGTSSSRVTLWRRLQRLGAVALTGTYILPDRDDCLEAFTWLLQEIRSAGGEALLMRVAAFESLTEKDLISRFHEARAEAYGELLTDLGELEASLKGVSKDQVAKSLAKFRKRFDDQKRIDFFESPAGRDVMTKLQALERRVSPPQGEEIKRLNRADYRDKVWVTRPRPHVDRLASGWLVRRFIDPEAQIVYRSTVNPDEVSFDMEAADFSHVGTLCTFEVLLVSFGLKDEALQGLAQIVHEIDLRDERYFRAETAGVDALLEGWLKLELSNEGLERRGHELFEGLYRSFFQS